MQTLQPSPTPTRRNARQRSTLPAALVASAALALAGCGGSDRDEALFKACQQVTATGSVVVGSGLAGDPAAPEPASGFKTGKVATVAPSYMVATANPLASQAGCEVLRDGGSAVDAAVAVQMVLGLVEPQSSGIGGGAFMLHYDAQTRRVQSYDGRETAPAAATENYLRHVSATDTSTPKPELASQFASVRASGRSIGTPGAVRMLSLAHQDHGKQGWSNLFQPGIRLATNGFPISGRLAAAIAGSRTDLLRDADAAGYFLNADLTAKALGTPLRNPAYAETLAAIAQEGANAFYTGPIAQSIVDKIGATRGGPASPVAITPGLTTLADLAGYQAVRREPVCGSYRTHVVCGMPPPSSGGIAVAQALGILENFDLASYPPTQVGPEGGKPAILAVHLVSEAERLAYADRNKYVADTDFVPLPGAGIASLLDRGYLTDRSKLISLTRSIGIAPAGNFGVTQQLASSANEGRGTSHVSIVDRNGNALALTTTVESSMGSFHFTRGFLLNNQLTDFSFDPSDPSGPIANRVQAGKRPRSSMAPTLVFAKNADGSRGNFVLATGSPGGAAIIQFVVKTLVATLDWKLDAQQAAATPNFGAANSATTGIGGEHPFFQDATGAVNNNDPLFVGLRALGHTVSTAAQSSGVASVVRIPVPGVPGTTQLQGGADPRREGIALGG